MAARNGTFNAGYRKAAEADNAASLTPPETPTTAAPKVSPGNVSVGPPAQTPLKTPVEPPAAAAPKELTEQQQISLAIKGTGMIVPALDTTYNIAAFPAVSSNPLNKFVSYNCLFTLSCLDKNMQNKGEFDPSKIKNVIARTQGDWGSDNRVRSTFGQYDYFLDDLIIVSQPALSSKTGESFATKITFKVTEPYSMGLFLDIMYEGAKQGGYSNFREASYLLMIEFAGYTDDNKPHAPDPSLTRYIPIKFLDVKLSVKSGGSTYDCEVIPYNEVAFRSPISNTKTAATLQGSTVGELLDTLEQGLNKFAQELIKGSEVDSTDEYFIYFPKDFSDPGNSGNDIKKSVVFRGDESGNIKFPNQDDTYDPAKGIINNRSLGRIDQEKKTYNFKTDTKVQDIISEVVIRSEYITNQLTNYKVGANKKGMINWFRVEIQIHDLKESELLNRQTRRYIYRVVPYEVHLSKLLPPKSVPVGYDVLKKTVNRIYDYLYTGKNTEIINVEVDFNMGFFSKVSADTGNNPGTNSKNFRADANVKDPGDGLSKSKTPTRTSNQQTPAIGLSGSAVASGKSGNDTDETIQVRNYREILTNPGDMIELKMTIMGDPYYLPSSGMGNQIKKPKGDNIMEDGSMNYQSGEVDIVFNFRTPIDLDPTTGLYKFDKRVDQFSGLFQIFEVESKFNQNKFTQSITAQRRRVQLQGSGENATLIGKVNG